MANIKPYYQDDESGITLYCARAEEVLPQLNEQSVDCVIADPPYGINYFSNCYVGKNPHSPIENDHELFLPLDQLWRVVRDGGVIFAFYSHKRPLVDPRIKNSIVWVKNNWSAGDLEGDFGNQFEMIAFIPKSGFKLKSKKRYSNVWYHDRVPPKLHPTQKPIDLIGRLVVCGSVEGEIILDPFVGSGTTLVAAKRLGRRAIGIEMSEAYCKIAVQRLSQMEMFVNESLKQPT
jgi:site-specific DNA-methyltransferase (adenine-specific)